MESDLDLLPESLRDLSLSMREIVLQWPEVQEAIDALTGMGACVYAWEGLALNPDDGHGHTLDTGISGLMPVQQMDDEAWEHYVQRASEIVTDTIKRNYDEWPEDNKVPGRELYFCLMLNRGL